MAVTEEIAWGDGSGDKIYLTADAFGGNQTVLVSSDANAGAARTKTVTFKSGIGSITQTLTVSQESGTPTPKYYDYLVFDGTAYIDTDIVFPTNGSIRVNAGGETTKAAQRIFQVATSGNGYIGVLLSSSTTSTTRYFSAYYGKSSAVSTNKTLPFSTSTYNLILTPKRFGVGNSVSTISKGNGTPSGGIVIGSNPNHNGQPFTGKMSYFRIYDDSAQNATSASDLLNNYTPVYTLKPCTYNGQVGMWCEETSKFYGNTAGAGTLTVSGS